MAAPATPCPRISTRMIFPITFAMFAIRDMAMGKPVFFCALKMEEPASYRAING